MFKFWFPILNDVIMNLESRNLAAEITSYLSFVPLICYILLMMNCISCCKRRPDMTQNVKSNRGFVKSLLSLDSMVIPYDYFVEIELI